MYTNSNNRIIKTIKLLKNDARSFGKCYGAKKPHFGNCMNEPVRKRMREASKWCAVVVE